MQDLGLANLRKYIFLHRRSGTLCHVYSEKVIITIFLIYYHCFFMIRIINYAELCPKFIMYTLFLFSTVAHFFIYFDINPSHPFVAWLYM